MARALRHDCVAPLRSAKADGTARTPSDDAIPARSNTVVRDPRLGRGHLRAALLSDSINAKEMVNVMKAPDTLKYAMISTEMRRDLDEPLRHFQHLDIVHLYRSNPINDLVPEDYGPRLVQYSSPRQLIQELRRIEPDVVQLLEPFALVNLRYQLALERYFRENDVASVAVSLENVPLDRKYTPLGGALVRRIARPLLERSRVVFYLNDGAKENLLDSGANPNHMYREMYGCWGVDSTEFSPDGDRVTLSSSPDEVVFLVIGRMVEAKGIFDILHAFAELKRRRTDPARLVMIGDGADRKRLESETERLGLGDSVDVLGTIRNRDLATYIRGSDVFVLAPRETRLWAEQVGMAFIQSMACGVPVIGTASGSIPEFIDHEEAGLLVPERNVGELANAMERLAEHAELRTRLGIQARRIVETRYDARRNIERIDQFLAETFRSPNPGSERRARSRPVRPIGLRTS
jgi:glycosyltransferase involved in cell wall biosynthesis